ncbi:MAG: FG-GAP repeat domain-containing protein [Planctomycetota bacterium]
MTTSHSKISALLLVLSGILTLPSLAKEESPAPLFENVASAMGLKGVEGAKVSCADINGDGLPDLIADRTKVFLNVGGKSFERSKGDTPLNAAARQADIVQVGDVNGDGIADLFLGRSTNFGADDFKDDGLRNEIWLGDKKGSFSLKKDSGVGLTDTTISACFLDADKDGILDLFVANSYVAYGKSLEASPSRLFLGKGDGTFKEVTKAARLEGVAEPGRPDSRRPAYGVAHTDWNNDGWQDILVLTYGRQANRLWRNNMDGTFTDVGAETTFDADEERDGRYPPIVGRNPEPPFRCHGNNFDGAVADFDNDGDMDCFIATIKHGWPAPRRIPPCCWRTLARTPNGNSSVIRQGSPAPP